MNEAEKFDAVVKKLLSVSHQEIQRREGKLYESTKQKRRSADLDRLYFRYGASKGWQANVTPHGA
jgi:hypothetical protein